MATYLITYDLNRPNQDYSKLYEEIKKYNRVQLSESSYAINTDKPLEVICSEIKKCVDYNDVIYVISLTPPWNGFGPKSTNVWLRLYLGATSEV
jgi:hypothetical protein